jgi:hypothetical protein
MIEATDSDIVWEHHPDRAPWADGSWKARQIVDNYLVAIIEFNFQRGTYRVFACFLDSEEDHQVTMATTLDEAKSKALDLVAHDRARRMCGLLTRAP